MIRTDGASAVIAAEHERTRKTAARSQNANIEAAIAARIPPKRERQIINLKNGAKTASKFFENRARYVIIVSEAVMNKEKLEFLNGKADDIRKLIIEMIGRLGVGHVGGSLSIVELLTVLYYDKARVNPSDPKDPDRDRIVLSKGHAGPALYSVLADKGYFPLEKIKTLNLPGTELPSHCDMNKTVGVDMTAGSLGQGLSCAVGMALAAKMDKKDYRVYAVIGDGESQEGQIWEAMMYAGNMKLDNLTIFLDNNKMQIDDYTDAINSIEPFDKKCEAFNLRSERVNGHDIAAISAAIDRAHKAKGVCTCIVLDTVKGHGVPFAESKGVGSHSFSISEAEWREFCNKEAD